jgi:acyl-coenzyme A thioesterase PaaI-like protein
MIDPRWSGAPVALEPGRARVVMVTLPEMAVDERRLVHGGFVFGLADHAAMLAVDDPLVVLVTAEVRFLAPVAVGDRLVAEARLEASEGRRRRVHCTVLREGKPVFEGELSCHVPARHVLDERPEDRGGAS